MHMSALMGVPTTDDHVQQQAAAVRPYRTKLVGPRTDCDQLRARRGRGTVKQRVVFHDRILPPSESDEGEEDGWWRRGRGEL